MVGGDQIGKPPNAPQGQGKLAEEEKREKKVRKKLTSSFFLYLYVSSVLILVSLCLANVFLILHRTGTVKIKEKFPVNTSSQGWLKMPPYSRVEISDTFSFRLNSLPRSFLLRLSSPLLSISSSSVLPPSFINCFLTFFANLSCTLNIQVPNCLFVIFLFLHILFF